MGRLTASKSGEIASFKTPYAIDIKSLKVHFSPKQLGSGDPSPENIRKIVGWDEVEVNGCKKNLFDYSHDEIKYNYYRNDNGEEVYSTSSFYTMTSYSIQPNCRIILYNGNNNFFAVRIYFLTQDEQWISRTNWLSSASKIILNPDRIPLNCKKIQLHFTISNPPVLDTFMLLVVNNAISYQWKRLPDEYQEVEYIESDGGQWIDTGTPINNGSIITIEFNMEESSVNRVIYGWRRQGVYTDSYQTLLGANQSKTRYFVFGAPSGNVNSIFYFSTKNKLIIDTYNKNVFINETIINNNINFNNGFAFDENGSSIYNPYLFSFNNMGSVGTAKGGGTKIYNYSVEYNNILIQNLIPCYRKSDNEIGMYDLVSNTFYTNQGTGSFTKGNDIEYAKDIYGGTVDLITGELIITHVKRFLNDPDKWDDSVTRAYGYGYLFTDREVGSNHNLISSIALPDSTAPWYVRWRTQTESSVFFRWASETTPPVTIDELKQLATENKISICYPLATPITYQLSPQQLQAFAGQNNLWSNADLVEVSYELIDTSDIQKAKKRIILNQPHIETAQGNIATFNTDMKAPLKECKVSFLPIQKGEGDPSPENVREIKGWNSIELSVTGKNLFDKNRIIRGYYIGIANNVPILAVSGTGGYEYVYVKGLSKIRSSGSHNWSAARYCFFDENMNFISEGGVNTKGNKSYTVPTDAVWVGVSAIVNSTKDYYDLDTLQIEAGNIATEYEPYNGTTISIDWQNDYGEIYGGYIDLIKGEVVQDWVCRDLTTMSSISAPNSQSAPWNHLFSVGHWVTNKGWEKKNGTNNFIIDCIKTLSTTTGISNYQASGVSNTYNIYIYDDTINTVAEFKEKYAGHYVAYPTKYPTTYQLTPQQILTLKNINNIWSNANGTIEVKYWKH